MSEEFTDPIDDTSLVGETSAAGGEIVQDEAPKRGWQSMGLFDYLLLISFVMIVLASMLMLWEYTKFGGLVWGSWNT